MTRSCLAFAGSRVGIQWSGDAAAELVRFAWAPHLQASAGDGAATLMLHSCAGGRYRLSAPGVEHGEVDARFALELLVERGTHLLARDNAAGLLLHAALASVTDGRAVLCPGPSGAGKTSLALWLSAGGFTHHSDELAFVPEGGGGVQGLSRPLCVKRSGLPVLQQRFGAMPTGCREVQDGVMVAASALASTPPGDAELVALVFPEHRAGAALALEPVGAGDAGMRLMAALVNARNLEGHGFAQVTRLARTVPAYKLTGGSFEGSAELIRGMVAQGATTS